MELRVITPETAARWLGALYARQRKHNNNAKTVYTSSMMAGHWKVSNDAICITKDGECINGQHRLMSVIETNEPIVAWVLFDADPSMYDIIDNIYARSAGQVLCCKNSNDIAAIAKALVVIESGLPFSSALESTTTIPRWQVTERADSDMDYLQELVRTYKTVRSRLTLGSGVGYGIAIHTFSVVMDSFEVADAIRYLDTPNETAINLQRTIQRKAKDNKRLNTQWVCGTFLQFLEAQHEGKTVKQYRDQFRHISKYEGLYRHAIGIAGDAQ